MRSCLWLERPAAWRSSALLTLLALALTPVTPLLWQAASSGEFLILTDAFWSSLRHSLQIASGVAALALFMGLPLGLLAALYSFPGRRAFLVLMTVPLLVPSFLWGIGWSALAARAGLTSVLELEGLLGCCLVFLSSAVPLVLWVTFAAARSLTATQIDAARLAGGERSVLIFAAGAVLASVLIASALAGILTLSDPGPGQILGQRTAAAEILTSFSALHDTRLAAWQCLTLTMAILILVVPSVALGGGRLSAQVLARQVSPPAVSPPDEAVWPLALPSVWSRGLFCWLRSRA